MMGEVPITTTLQKISEWRENQEKLDDIFQEKKKSLLLLLQAVLTKQTTN